MSKQFTALVLGLMLAAICLPLAAQTYSFQSFSYPNAVSNYLAWAQGINNRGAVVGSVVFPGSNYLGFKRDANGVLERPFDADPAMLGATIAYGITDHGLIVGSVSANRTTTGFLLYQGVFTYYNAQPGWNTEIYGVNNRGDFVGVASKKGQSSYGFINSNGVVTKIQCPPSRIPYSIEPRGIAADGTVVGMCYVPQAWNEGFIRGPAGRYKIIQVPGVGQDVRVHGINSLAHKIVGYYWGYGMAYHGFVYDYITDTATTVDYPGAKSTFVYGINSHGVIVGSASDPQGKSFSFIGTPQ